MVCRHEDAVIRNKQPENGCSRPDEHHPFDPVVCHTCGQATCPRVTEETQS